MHLSQLQQKAAKPTRSAAFPVTYREPQSRGFPSEELQSANHRVQVNHPVFWRDEHFCSLHPSPCSAVCSAHETVYRQTVFCPYSHPRFHYLRNANRICGLTEHKTKSQSPETNCRHSQTGEICCAYNGVSCQVRTALPPLYSIYRRPAARKSPSKS